MTHAEEIKIAVSNAKLEIYRAIFVILLEAQSLEDAKARIIMHYDSEYLKKETMNENVQNAERH